MAASSPIAGDSTIPRAIHPDVYQVLAYLVATRLQAGLLVYASGLEPEITHVLRDGREIAVASLNLTAPPENLLDQVRHVASDILAMRAREWRIAS